MHGLTVIKVGGGEGIELDAIVDEFASLVLSGVPAILVHGGSHETNVLAEALGHAPETLTSPSGHTSRRTDRRTLEIFEMVYCGKINKGVVERLRQRGVDAIGLSGLDAGIWRGDRKNAIRAVRDGRTMIVRDDLSGRVRSVDTSLLNLLMDAGKTLVLTPPAVTDDGVAINVDADRAAAATAIAMDAAELLLLSNVPGVCRDAADPTSVIDRVSVDTLDEVRSCARGRMKNKVLAAEEAIRAGVGGVVIGSAAGSVPGPGSGAIARARGGHGTVFSEEVHV